MAKFNVIETLKNFKELTKELSTRLRALTFDDNFDSFEANVVVPGVAAPGNEITVRNQLTVEPSRYIIVSQTGGGLITRGSVWNNNYISFKNASTSEDATITVIVMR